jgi:thiosulfate dehydrogenase
MTRSAAHRTALIAAAATLGLVAACKQAAAPADAPSAAPAQQAAFAPPSLESIPDGPQGEAIRRGRALFINTGAAAPRYAGSGLNCSNCHLDEGRLANAAPMWAAWGMYPAYRTKNDQINTMEDRILGCFTFSMNAPAAPAGGPPPYGDDIYRDLQSYFAWLATGAPAGVEMSGRGFVTVPKPALAPDPARGRAVYEQQCSACHQPGGEGMRNPDGTYANPPLWGAGSFNWGAGMARIATAAGFIKSNMPLGQGGTLNDQQAWDVAAYITSRERPRDPRQTGSIEAARERFHATGDYYGQWIDGDLLGDGK